MQNWEAIGGKFGRHRWHHGHPDHFILILALAKIFILTIFTPTIGIILFVHYVGYLRSHSADH